MHISLWFAGRKEKSMKYLNKVVEIILEVLVAGMVLGCCWQVITRFVLHNPSKYTEELLRYMLIWPVSYTHLDVYKRQVSRW